MPSVNDWAAKAAKKIHSERFSSVERKAAIIATHAAPLLALVQELRTPHADECANLADELPCDCGADQKNLRIETALAGIKP